MGMGVAAAPGRNIAGFVIVIVVVVRLGVHPVRGVPVSVAHGLIVPPSQGTGRGQGMNRPPCLP